MHAWQGMHDRAWPHVCQNCVKSLHRSQYHLQGALQLPFSAPSPYIRGNEAVNRAPCFAAGCCQVRSSLIVCMHAHTLQIFIFMANDNNHSWAYATHNFEIASAEETLRSMRVLAGITSASASTEVRSPPCH